jgi:hypothetical protein
LLLAVVLSATLQAAPPPESKPKEEKIPFCDDIKEPPAGEYTCRLKNVWKPIPQPKLEEPRKDKSSAG